MSLGGDLALSWLAQAGAPTLALFTPLGVGAPLLDASSSVLRLASRPTGGVRLEPYRAYEPPCDVRRSPEDAARIADSAPLFVDVASAELEETRAALASIGVAAPAIARIRGAAPPPWPDMSKIFQTGDGAEAIWAGPAFSGYADDAALGAIAAAASDEFDVLRRLARRGRFTALRHRRAAAEVAMIPATALDAPDGRQIDHALGEGVAVFDRDGEAALALPTVGADGGGFRVEVEGLSPEAPSPRIRGEAPADWTVETARDGGRWRLVAKTTRRREAERVEIAAPGSPDAWIEAVWIGVRRRRGDWEIWDEAEARLNLEESW